MTRSGVSAAMRVHGLRRAGGGDHAIAGPLEDDAVDLEEVVVVVDDQYECLVCVMLPWYSVSPPVGGRRAAGDRPGPLRPPASLPAPRRAASQTRSFSM